MLDFRLYIVKPLFRRSATSTTGTTTTARVRPFCITDSRSRHQAETEKEIQKDVRPSRKWVNIKELWKWTRILLRILKICIALIEKRNLEKAIMEVVQDFKI